MDKATQTKRKGIFVDAEGDGVDADGDGVVVKGKKLARLREIFENHERVHRRNLDQMFSEFFHCLESPDDDLD